MTSYLSGLLSKLQMPNIIGSAIAKENISAPFINYITMYCPDLVSEKAESFEELYNMILFFAAPTEQIDKQSQLSLVGLVRGSCSLAMQFNPRSGPTTITVEGGAIVIVEVEKGYFVACSVAISTESRPQRRLVEIQIERLLVRFHRYFKILYSSAEDIFSGGCSEQQKAILEEYYTELIENYNGGALVRGLKRALIWPNSLCYQGLLSFFSQGSYKKSSVKVPDSHRPDLEALWERPSVKPAAVLIAHTNKTIPKREGLMYSKCSGGIDPDALVDVYGLLEFFSFHERLEASRLGSARVFKDLFRKNDEGESPSLPETTDQETVSSLHLAPSTTTFELLHPTALAKSLASPLSSTLDGLRYLGSTVNEQLPSTSWIPFFRGAQAPAPEPAPEAVADVNSPDVASVASSDSNKGTFVMGPDHDNNIYSFLVYLPVTRSGETTIEEFSVVIYLEDKIIVAFIFESSAQELADPAFFDTLRADVCEPAVELIQECVALTSGGMALNSSISSLPNPVGNIISGKNDENPDVDSDFFYIIYDTKEKSFQSSLPALPQPQLLADLGKEVAQISSSYQNAFFHLHDQLADYFVMRSAGNIFKDGSVREQLHKFSTNKYNDWLMYLIRHRQKSIIIIRNYNAKHKQKTKISKEVREASQAGSWTSSVYDYAHLGFLDSLGDDVKVWLGGIGSTQEDAGPQDDVESLAGGGSGGNEAQEHSEGQESTRGQESTEGDGSAEGNKTEHEHAKTPETQEVDGAQGSNVNEALENPQLAEDQKADAQEAEPQDLNSPPSIEIQESTPSGLPDITEAAQAQAPGEDAK